MHFPHLLLALLFSVGLGKVNKSGVSTFPVSAVSLFFAFSVSTMLHWLTFFSLYHSFFPSVPFQVPLAFPVRIFATVDPRQGGGARSLHKIMHSVIIHRKARGEARRRLIWGGVYWKAFIFPFLVSVVQNPILPSFFSEVISLENYLFTAYPNINIYFTCYNTRLLLLCRCCCPLNCTLSYFFMYYIY